MARYSVKRSANSMPPKRQVKKGTLKRIIKMLISDYKYVLPILVVLLIVGAICGSIGSIFIKNITSAITDSLDGVISSSEAMKQIINIVIIMICVFSVGVISNYVCGLVGAIVTQGFLKKTREKMFNKMQSLPIRYFDTHTHGDIMSVYTNDIDAIRELVSQSIPQVIACSVTVVTLIVLMLYFSFWLTLVVAFGVVAMFFVTSKVGGRSAKFFVSQQQSLGKVEGYIEEMMHGQKVVKVFNHEEENKKKFNELNEKLCKDACAANENGNMLMPILANIGNILYVLVAFIGGALFILNAQNVGFYYLFGGSGSLMGKMEIAIVVGYLGMAKQFTGQIQQISQQINSVVMALAGADRVFEILDQESENYEGYVTLVNANIDENGNITESQKRTGKWAWKHPHGDGTTTYTELKGDIVMNEVDFGYNEEKIVLHDVTLYAKPGQKVAFVGATGAGKTTITNLLNRFYDIADGKIRYDGININKIKKADLRRSLGIVLQDTNLFTGTVMENIRYGKLDATDEEVYEAAKLANAHDFITRLPDGYNTMLTHDGSNLSQGQRQLLSIARAAVCNAPVMILDEATSSIDTRTERIVQDGTDKLMHGRTVFVIAHRLSTVQNADVIMVLEKGRIIERGSHKELIDKKGKYYQLYTGSFELE